MRTVNGQTIGDIFEWDGDQYRATRFTTEKSVLGECIKSDKIAMPTGCNVPITSVTWITKMRASTGKQAFSVPNNVEGRMFIDLAKMFKRKGVRVIDKARSKDKQSKNADWFSVYINNPNDNLFKENRELKQNLVILDECLDKYKSLEKTLNKEIGELIAENDIKCVKLNTAHIIRKRLENEILAANKDANQITIEITRQVRILTEHNAKPWYKRFKQINFAK